MIVYANHEWAQVDTNDYGRFFETCLKSSDEAINFFIFSVFSLFLCSKPTSMYEALEAKGMYRTRSPATAVVTSPTTAGACPLSTAAITLITPSHSWLITT